MKKLKSIICLLLTAVLAATAFPAYAGISDTVGGGEKLLNNGVVIDTDAAGGYAGDYVVIYNPEVSTSWWGGGTSNGVSTGSLEGLIETTIEADAQPVRDTSEWIVDEDRPYRIDVDSQFGYEDINSLTDNETKASYPVGTTKNFTISNYSPGGSSIQFQVLYVGDHCRIWTVTNSSYYPLDAIDSSYAQTVAEMFDAKYDLMNVSYGDFRDSNSDGKVNLMFYNIDDGWEPGQGYVAGYFWSGDFSYNSLPMIHIDTYPGIQWETTSGETKVDLESCYGTIVHEFQHLINYSETGGMDTWLNESFSGSAEELCFPSSGLFSRIQSWHNYYFSAVSELADPPAEYEYNSAYGLHTGGALAEWNDSDDDIYARYAEVMLFSQYLYTYTGGTTVYKTIIDSVANGTAEVTAVRNALGVTAEELWGGFFTAMVANDPYSTEGTYGFDMSAGYDPADCYDLETVYQILSPVIYTSTSAATIYGSGFITVKPVNNVYNPPSDASSTLRYVGITLPTVTTNTYTVTFEDWDGTVLSTQTVEEGGSATPPADPTREGYDFAGWSGSYTNVTADVTITATYTIKTYTVTFYGYDNAVLSTQTVEHGGNAAPPAAPEVEGYTFTGWSGSYTNITADTDVYAQYAANTYTVTFYGFNNEVLSTQTVEHGGNAAPPTAPEVEGYTFTGWSGSYTNITADTDVYAQYAANTYTVTFYGFNNEVLSTQTVEHGGNAAPPAAPEVEGYTFTGWSGSYTNITADTDVYAQYAVNTYTVTFYGFNNEVLSTQTVEHGGNAAPPTAPEVEGYTFTGWSGSYTNITADTVIYAIYEEDAGTVTLLGDVNCDGRVDYADVSVLYCYLLNITTISEQGVANADVDADGSVNFADVTILYRMLTNLT